MEDGTFLMPFLSVVGLIFMSAFFSGSETGMTSVTRAKIFKLKMEGNKRAIILSKLREDKERLIGAILLGNNIVNIAASAIATALAIRYVGEAGVVYATAIMTILVLVFAEVLPKTYAVRHAETVALFVAPIFVYITKILSPFTKAVQLIVNSALRLISSEVKENMSGVEVLRGAVDMYHEEGNVLKEDKDMLSGILDLEAVEIKDIMIHRSDIKSFNINDPIKKIIHDIANSAHSRIPLWEESPDKVVGIVHTKDVFKAVEGHDGDIETLDLKSLIKKPWFVPESITLKNQLKAFRDNQRHFALVIDEYGSITGLITLEDIIEEIVGDIEDEHDLPNYGTIRKYKNGAYNVNGNMSIRDLNRELEWQLPDDDALTIAGLVMASVQRIPEVGEVCEVDDYMLKVLKKKGNQITRIQIRDTKNQHKKGKANG